MGNLHWERGSLFNIVIRRLPDIHFIDTEKDYTLKLSECGRKIRYLSEVIQVKFGEKKKIGLVFPSAPELVLQWLAVLDAGKEPLILQYPTKKQSLNYWQGSVLHTIQEIGIEGIICDKQLEELKPIFEEKTTVLFFDGNYGEADSVCEKIVSGSVIQLSSGTTGYRKAVRFSIQQLEKHAVRYNSMLNLTNDDCIVSWLPLYHDMGFIACFIMPLILSIPIVMMDPITWVENRELLFAAISKYNGTICYMPNFGFEVMAHVKWGKPLSTMRHWISCSEPTYYKTIEKFCKVTGTDSGIVSTCYAMAENVFAISKSDGFKIKEHNGKHTVSCGALVPNTFVKFVDGEIYVKSDTSISSYMDGVSIIDSDGYYPTGDMGFMDEGQLFIEGRKHDVMIQAGKKYMLSDLDFLLNETVPDCRGRGACVAIEDSRMGTQTLCVILEREKFFDKSEYNEIYKKLSAVFPLESFELEFVPEEFITKTSSGKINRKKTANDVILAREWQKNEKGVSGKNIRNEIGRFFSYLPYDLPIKDVLDSLGYVLINVIADEFGISISQQMSLEEIIEKVDTFSTDEDECLEEECLYIVSLWDYWGTIYEGDPVKTEQIQKISAEIGVPIRFEHICLPPRAELVLNDLIFSDYFLCRDYDDRYKDYLDCIRKIKRASILLFNDASEYGFVKEQCVFPKMNKSFKRSSSADYLAVRYQKYAWQHHLLPIDLVGASEFPVTNRDEIFKNLVEYLDIPIFRAAYSGTWRDYTTNWEFKDFNNQSNYYKENFFSALTDFLIANKNKWKLRSFPKSDAIVKYNDAMHFCAFCINPAVIEKVLKQFNSFIIHGWPNSLPYLTKRLKEENKDFVFVTTLDSKDGFGKLEQKYECILQTGPWLIERYCKSLLPVIQIVESSRTTPKMVNVPAELKIADSEYFLGSKEELQIMRLCDANVLVMSAELLTADTHSDISRMIVEKMGYESYLWGVVDLHSASDNYTEVFKALDILSTITEDCPRLYEREFLLCEKLGDRDGSFQYLKKYIEVVDDISLSRRIRHYIINVYGKGENSIEFLRDVLQFLHIEPKDSKMFLVLAAIFFELGFYEEVLEAIRKYESVVFSSSQLTQIMEHHRLSINKNINEKYKSAEFSEGISGTSEFAQLIQLEDEISYEDLKNIDTKSEKDIVLMNLFVSITGLQAMYPLNSEFVYPNKARWYFNKAEICKRLGLQEWRIESYRKFLSFADDFRDADKISKVNSWLENIQN
ncbi:acyl-CoA synthetase (AMP-forming)/AMP-acid ligase II/tetratricopeptide (TPR) repeat protein [Sporomusaceae bacterium BoRhaA]|uniref:AMP-binding protein n=1 Tax=Pelorhabdus rhamnosifermentans TaxID=2772457 RepID=UPI001C060380|nr:AMP-binding protein [Pelorhabdus rhamnosifermentans]MBU2699173.1 acyl-CoA synthetase (AMP-forming)/AMP-acid ligase II/tetratricopeptide (TPR) repeat protein [Pelorhabdus rhamnosifermentans]